MVKKAIYILMGIFICAYPLIFKDPFLINMGITIILFAILGEAWNILGGYTGLTSLGHAVFFSVGAYTSTILFMGWGLSPWIGMPIGGFLAAIVAVIIAYPTSRLFGHYFAISTICIGEIFHIILVNCDFVGGAVGLMIPIKEHGFKNFQFHHTKAPYYYIILIMLVIVIIIMMKLEKSRFGFYIRAIRDNEEAARSLGVNSRRCKIFAAALSALITGWAGTFFAQYVLFIDPFSIMAILVSVQIATMAILGGLGTIAGPIIGAIVLIPASEFTRVYFAAGARSFHLILYGFIIIVMVKFKPEGLITIYTKDFKQWWRKKLWGRHHESFRD